MRIADVEQHTGISRHTVRYYERIGLLSAPPRSANNYREYSAASLARLRFIRDAQEMGFSLEEIRQIVALQADGQITCADGALLIWQKRQQIAERLAQLTRLDSFLATEQERLVHSAREHGYPLAAELLPAAEDSLR